MSIHGGISKRAALVAVLAAVTVLVPATAAAKHKPGSGGGGGGTFSTTSTYVKNYANLVGGTEAELTPRDVQATPDGGWIALGSTSTQSGAGVSLLIKANAFGASQWQEEIGCLNGAPGDYGDGVSLQLTSDGGYVVAGGTIGCGSASVCPELSGIQCGFVEKLDSTGRLLWSRAYTADAGGTSFDAIEQTTDGGYVVAGNASDSAHRPGGLVVKLDANGNVQWQRELGPTSTSWALLSAVQQSADGGFVAAGTFNDGTNNNGVPLTSVLAVKLDAAGNLVWERGFNDVVSGKIAATEHVNALEQTSDGGYAIGGDWNDSPSFGECCQGALLLELAPDGSLRGQQAYSGGLHCTASGEGTQCSNLGGIVYSLRRTADGGFVLAGTSSLPLSNETPSVPWLAKVNATGAIAWQENITQALATTGAPLSQYFAAVALTATGPIAIGSTENYSNGLNELLGAQTDSNGAVGTCSQVQPATVLSVTDPGLVPIAPGLPPQAPPLSSQSGGSAQTLATTPSATSPQC